MIDENGVEWVQKIEMERRIKKAARDAEEAAADLQKETESAIKKAAKLEERVGTLEAELATATERHATERAFLAAGVTDPKVQKIVEVMYAELPPEDRPSLAEYLSGPAREDSVLARVLGTGDPAPAPESAGPAPAPVQEAAAAAPRPPHRPNAAVQQPGRPAPAHNPLREVLTSSAHDVIAKFGGDRDAAIRAIAEMD